MKIISIVGFRAAVATYKCKKYTDYYRKRQTNTSYSLLKIQIPPIFAKSVPPGLLFLLLREIAVGESPCADERCNYFFLLELAENRLCDRISIISWQAHTFYKSEKADASGEKYIIKGEEH